MAEGDSFLKPVRDIEVTQAVQDRWKKRWPSEQEEKDQLRRLKSREKGGASQETSGRGGARQRHFYVAFQCRVHLVVRTERKVWRVVLRSSFGYSSGGRGISRLGLEQLEKRPGSLV